ncbi:MAG: AarF/UbiB family protein [Endomicrobia bacterium]|nr:AarF/UbiB family protein [Endomicrobiia bacterium]MCL2506700.1 AarF/UbiB family protein [Endomicrobiia bacterium]
MKIFSKISVKLISLTAACAFFVTSVCGSFAYGMEYSDKSKTFIFKDFSVVQTPADLSKPVVFLIQDLHCHKETQIKIANFIESSANKYGIRSVFVEGASLEASLTGSLLENIEDASLKQKLIESMLNSGKLTGAEYYKLTKNGTVALIGIEDEIAYNQNLARLEVLQKSKNNIDNIIKTMDARLTDIQTQNLHRATLKILKLKNNSLSGNMKTAKYNRLLKKYLNDSNIVEKSEYNDLFYTTGKINIKKTQKEISGLANYLKENTSYNQYSQIIKETGNFSNLYEIMPVLKRLDLNIDIAAQFPYLNKYLTQITKNASTDSYAMHLLSEKLKNSILFDKALSRTETEVIILSEMYFAFKALVRQNATERDYLYINGWQPQAFAALWEKYSGAPLDNLTQNYLSLSLDYYALNNERNFIFAEKICRQISKNNDKFSIVVTGGFHGENLKDILEDNGISCVTMTPLIHGLGAHDKLYSKNIQLREFINAFQLKLFLSYGITEQMKLAFLEINDNFRQNGELQKAVIDIVDAYNKSNPENPIDVNAEDFTEIAKDVYEMTIKYSSGEILKITFSSDNVEFVINENNEPVVPEQENTDIPVENNNIGEDDKEQIKKILEQYPELEGNEELKSGITKVFNVLLDSLVKRGIISPEQRKEYNLIVSGTDEANAFCIPATKTVVVTKTILNEINWILKYENGSLYEDHLAALLAHEIEHSLQERIIYDTENKNFGKQVLAKIKASGQSKKNEYDSDISSIEIISEAGYNPRAVKDMLSALSVLTSLDFDLSHSHPNTTQRANKIATLINDKNTPVTNSHKPYQQNLSDFFPESSLWYKIKNINNLEDLFDLNISLKKILEKYIGIIMPHIGKNKKKKKIIDIYITKTYPDLSQNQREFIKTLMYDSFYMLNKEGKKDRDYTASRAYNQLTKIKNSNEYESLLEILLDDNTEIHYYPTMLLAMIYLTQIKYKLEINPELIEQISEIDRITHSTEYMAKLLSAKEHIQILETQNFFTAKEEHTNEILLNLLKTRHFKNLPFKKQKTFFPDFNNKSFYGHYFYQKNFEYVADFVAELIFKSEESQNYKINALQKLYEVDKSLAVLKHLDTLENRPYLEFDVSRFCEMLDDEYDTLLYYKDYFNNAPVEELKTVFAEIDKKIRTSKDAEEEDEEDEDDDKNRNKYSYKIEPLLLLLYFKERGFNAHIGNTSEHKNSLSTTDFLNESFLRHNTDDLINSLKSQEVNLTPEDLDILFSYNPQWRGSLFLLLFLSGLLNNTDLTNHLEKFQVSFLNYFYKGASFKKSDRQIISAKFKSIFMESGKYMSAETIFDFDDLLKNDSSDRFEQIKNTVKLLLNNIGIRNWKQTFDNITLYPLLKYWDKENIFTGLDSIESLTEAAKRIEDFFINWGSRHLKNLETEKLLTLYFCKILNAEPRETNYDFLFYMPYGEEKRTYKWYEPEENFENIKVSKEQAEEILSAFAAVYEYLPEEQKSAFARLIYKLFKNNSGNLSYFETFDEHLTLIDKLCPETSVLKDDFIYELLESFDIGTKNYLTVKNKLSFNDYRTNSDRANVKALFIDIAQSACGGLSAKEKGELLLWLIDSQKNKKPKRIRYFEILQGVSIDYLKESFWALSPNEKFDFLSAFLEGSESLFKEIKYPSLSQELQNLNPGKAAAIKNALDVPNPSVSDLPQGIKTDKSVIRHYKEYEQFLKNINKTFVDKTFGKDKETVAELTSIKFKNHSSNRQVMLLNDIISSLSVKTSDEQLTAARKKANFITSSAAASGTVIVKVMQIAANQKMFEDIKSDGKEINEVVSGMKGDNDPLRKTIVFDTLAQTPLFEKIKTVSRRLGSASIAQTHLISFNEPLTDNSGQKHYDTVIKVKRPSVIKHREEDFYVFEKLLQYFKIKYPKLAMPSREQLQKIIDEELDFGIEERNTVQLNKNMKSRNSDIRMPVILNGIEQLTGNENENNFLLQEFINGKILDKANAGGEIYFEILKEFFAEVFEDGFFHADLHGANIIIEDDGKIVFIDAGACGKVENDKKQVLADIFFALITKDFDMFTSAVKRYSPALAKKTKDKDFVKSLKSAFSEQKTEARFNNVFIALNKLDEGIPEDLLMFFQGISKIGKYFDKAGRTEDFLNILMSYKSNKNDINWKVTLYQTWQDFKKEDFSLKNTANFTKRYFTARAELKKLQETDNVFTPQTLDDFCGIVRTAYLNGAKTTYTKEDLMRFVPDGQELSIEEKIMLYTTAKILGADIGIIINNDLDISGFNAKTLVYYMLALSFSENFKDFTAKKQQILKQLQSLSAQPQSDAAITAQKELIIAQNFAESMLLSEAPLSYDKTQYYSPATVSDILKAS